jgi:putative ABC transport system permease protein
LLAVVLVVLTGYAALLAHVCGFGIGRQILTAGARATGQLAAVSLVIVAVVDSIRLTAGFITLMFAVASVTAGRRVGPGQYGRWSAALAIGAGVAPVLTLLLVSGLVPPVGVAVLPVAGILIGGAMTAAGLAGSRARDELAARHGEYEAGLALGLPRRPAALEVCRVPAVRALVPVMDQTRTVGLVTLPGAFVGMLLGGSDPITAGAVQLLVLVGLLAAETVAVAVAIEMVVARLRP